MWSTGASLCCFGLSRKMLQPALLVENTLLLPIPPLFLPSLQLRFASRTRKHFRCSSASASPPWRRRNALALHVRRRFARSQCLDRFIFLEEPNRNRGSFFSEGRWGGEETFHKPESNHPDCVDKYGSQTQGLSVRPSCSVDLHPWNRLPGYTTRWRSIDSHRMQCPSRKCVVDE